MKRVVSSDQFEDQVITVQSTRIHPMYISDAEQILVDNGIPRDEAQVVLQAIGYALIDTELYPD